MTIKNDCPAGRSQFLTSESDDKIVVDRQTFKKLFLLLGRCANNLMMSRRNEIFLTSLKNYLPDFETDEASKSLLLLGIWLDVVPEALEETAGWLDEAKEIMNVILSASKLGGRND
jgi:hypothetical protein